MDRLWKENVSSPWTVLTVYWRRMCRHHGPLIEGECVVTMGRFNSLLKENVLSPLTVYWRRMYRHHGQLIEGECVATMDSLLKENVSSPWAGLLKENVSSPWAGLLKENVSSPWAVYWRRMCRHHGQFIEGECVVTMDSLLKEIVLPPWTVYWRRMCRHHGPV